MNTDSNSSTAALTALGRVLLAAIFIWAGFGKLMAPGMYIGYIAHVGLPAPQAAYVVAVIVEFLGGLALLLGFQTRVVAAALGVFCLVTAFAVHGFADQNNTIHAMKNISMAGGFLFVIAYGAGAWSVDAMRQGRHVLSTHPA
ncbi:MAG: DoxX family protein [Rhodospirillales bacterium]|nr:DoxX family protein [Rhodospirillales bacterium]